MPRLERAEAPDVYDALVRSGCKVYALDAQSIDGTVLYYYLVLNPGVEELPDYFKLRGYKRIKVKTND